MDLPERFVEHVRERALLPAGARVLVACSGGADSTALALLVAGARDALALGDVVLAHFDHALRPDSAADAERVRALAATLGLRCVAARAACPPRDGAGPEDAARRARLAFLARTAAEQRATHVVTAHHLDDQAETLLLRILRGTGLRGLAGIPERRRLVPGVELVRPLLTERRAALRELVAGRGLTWSEDPTNRAGNARARLRTQALPVLAAAAGRDPAPLLARLAENAADTRRVLASRTSVARAFLRRDASSVVALPGFERLPRALLAAALQEVVPGLRGGRELTRAETRRLAAALLGADTTAPAGLAVTDRAGHPAVVAAEPRAARETPTPVPLAVPGTTSLWDGARVCVTLATAGDALLQRLERGRRTLELADADTVRGGLVARTRRPGERMQVLGASSPARLGHLLQRRGVARAARDRVPVVCDDEGPVWVAGLAPAERLRVRSETRRVLVLEFVA